LSIDEENFEEPPGTKVKGLHTNREKKEGVGKSGKSNKTIVCEKDTNKNSNNELPDLMETDKENSLESTPRKKDGSKFNQHGLNDTSIKEST
jgi:hypothetical protein